MFSHQYANDDAYPSLTTDGPQGSHVVMSEAWINDSLIVNTMKTIIRMHVKNTENVVYLGSNVSFSGDLTNEIPKTLVLLHNPLAVRENVCLQA